MSDSIKLGSVALECPDARQLAAFYAEITGGTVTSADQDWATLKAPGGDIDFQTAPGYQPPAWPDPSSSMQMHLGPTSAGSRKRGQLPLTGANYRSVTPAAAR